MNAQRKALDVWLNYRCERCDSTWKRPVIERRPVGEIDPHQLEAFFRDDPLVARRLAFDVAQLCRQSVVIDAHTDVRVHRVTIAPDVDDIAPLCIRLALPVKCAVRLDRLLALQLGLSRTALHSLWDRGELHVSPARNAPLRRPIHDRQRIWLGAPRFAN